MIMTGKKKKERKKREPLKQPRDHWSHLKSLPWSAHAGESSAGLRKAAFPVAPTHLTPSLALGAPPSVPGSRSPCPPGAAPRPPTCLQGCEPREGPGPGGRGILQASFPGLSFQRNELCLSRASPVRPVCLDRFSCVLEM